MRSLAAGEGRGTIASVRRVWARSQRPVLLSLPHARPPSPHRGSHPHAAQHCTTSACGTASLPAKRTTAAVMLPCRLAVPHRTAVPPLPYRRPAWCSTTLG
jgi:hypothetical protein